MRTNYFPKLRVPIRTEQTICVQHLLDLSLQAAERGLEPVLDISSLTTVDSRDLCALVELRSRLSGCRVPFRVQASPALRHTLQEFDLTFLLEDETENEERSAILFCGTLGADLKQVRPVLDRLAADLEQAQVGDETADEIQVAFDEALTNAVIETLRNNEAHTDHDPQHRSILVNWEIQAGGFFATIVDCGGGIDLGRTMMGLPRFGSDRFEDDLERHQAANDVSFRHQGETRMVKRLGAGLRLMAAFMDSVVFRLIADNVPHKRAGSVTQLYRKLP